MSRRKKKFSLFFFLEQGNIRVARQSGYFLQRSLGSVAWRLLSGAALGTHRGQISPPLFLGEQRLLREACRTPVSLQKSMEALPPSLSFRMHRGRIGYSDVCNTFPRVSSAACKYPA